MSIDRRRFLLSSVLASALGTLPASIARAMIGKETGDVVEVNTPGGVKAYEILKVEWL